jgi:ATP-dependent helicase/DNAse subunit B
MVAKNGVKEMKEGNISPMPYDSTCKYCAYGAVCGYDGEERKEDSISPSQIAHIAKNEKEKI